MPRSNYLPATPTVMRVLLLEHSISQNALVKFCKVSAATISLVVCRHQYPVTQPEVLARKIAEFLRLKGIDETSIQNAIDNNLQACPKATELFQNEPPRVSVPEGNLSPRQHSSNNLLNPEPVMIPKTRLSQEAKKQFGLFRNPFDGVITSAAEYYRAPEIMYVREAVYDAASNSRFVVVVGESGSGKSTLRQDLHERVKSEGKRIIIAEPYVLGMEGNDFKGRQTLSAMQIAHSLINAIDPGTSIKVNTQAMFKQLHNLLIAQHEQGYKVALVIEEAHGLPKTTLKHLKRFLELTSGFTSLLGVILIGQPELLLQLSSHNAELREVFGRAELVDMPQFDKFIREYLEFKFAGIQRKASDFLAESAYPAILARLSIRNRDGKGTRSLCYPLMLNNLMTHLLNSAATLSQKIDADLIEATHV